MKVPSPTSHLSSSMVVIGECVIEHPDVPEFCSRGRQVRCPGKRVPMLGLEPPISLTPTIVSVVWARTMCASRLSAFAHLPGLRLKGLRPHCLQPTRFPLQPDIYPDHFKNDSRNYIQPVARGLRLGAKSESGRSFAFSIAVSAFQKMVDRGASPPPPSFRYVFCPQPALISAFPGVGM